MRILAELYQFGLLVLGVVCWAVKMAVYIWSGAFLVLVGGLALVSAFFLTVCAFAVAVEMLRLYH